MPEETTAASSPALARVARSVGDDMQAAGFEFDPTILITILLPLLQALLGCGLSPAQALAAASDPGPLQRLRMRRLVKQHAPKTADVEVVEAALTAAADKLTVADMRALMAEARR